MSSNNKITLSELAEQVGGKVEGNGSVIIIGVAPIEKAVAGQISFIANNRYKIHIETTKASALILDPETDANNIPCIRIKNPYLAFAKVIDIFYPKERTVEAGVDASSVIHESASIDSTVGIGPLCHVSKNAKIGNDSELISSVYVGRDVVIGDNCLFYPGVNILDGTKIGNNVIIHSSTVIGSDGFGYAESETGLKKIKQVGWVEIDDNVEIGSNVSVDRGALGPTRIGKGTKIDNLVQVAHNVEIGQHTIIVSQVGISGSTKIGNGVILAGQVGMVGHIELGDGVKVGAQSGLNKSVPAGKTVFGSPARDKMTAMRIEAALTRLPDLLKEFRILKKKFEK